MASGRMLRKKISTDGRWADLANDTHRLLFTVGIPHLDIEGRISGDPREFKAAVAPMLDHITKEVVSEFFDDASRLGLIRRYQAEDRWVVNYPGFHKNQSLRPEKEAASLYPAPTGECLPSGCDFANTPGELPEYSRTTPAKEKRREDKLSEVNIREKGEPESAPPADGKTVRSRLPFSPDDLAKLWNEVADPVFPRVTIHLSEARAKKIRPVIKAHPEISWWTSLFKMVGEVPFLTGVNGRGWRANFDFVIKNHQEILEGKYDGHQGSTQPGSGSGQPPRGYDQRQDQEVIGVPE